MNLSGQYFQNPQSSRSSEYLHKEILKDYPRGQPTVDVRNRYPFVGKMISRDAYRDTPEQHSSNFLSLRNDKTRVGLSDSIDQQRQKRVTTQVDDNSQFEAFDYKPGKCLQNIFKKAQQPKFTAECILKEKLSPSPVVSSGERINISNVLLTNGQKMKTQKVTVESLCLSRERETRKRIDQDSKGKILRDMENSEVRHRSRDSIEPRIVTLRDSSLRHNRNSTDLSTPYNDRNSERKAIKEHSNLLLNDKGIRSYMFTPEKESPGEFSSMNHPKCLSKDRRDQSKAENTFSFKQFSENAKANILHVSGGKVGSMQELLIERKGSSQRLGSSAAVSNILPRDIPISDESKNRSKDFEHDSCKIQISGYESPIKQVLISACKRVVLLSMENERLNSVISSLTENLCLSDAEKHEYVKRFDRSLIQITELEQANDLLKKAKLDLERDLKHATIGTRELRRSLQREEAFTRVDKGDLQEGAIKSLKETLNLITKDNEELKNNLEDCQRRYLEAVEEKQKEINMLKSNSENNQSVVLPKPVDKQTQTNMSGLNAIYKQDSKIANLFNLENNSNHETSSQISQLQAEISNLKTVITHKDTHISTLETEIKLLSTRTPTTQRPREDPPSGTPITTAPPSNHHDTELSRPQTLPPDPPHLEYHLNKPAECIDLQGPNGLAIKLKEIGKAKEESEARCRILESEVGELKEFIQAVLERVEAWKRAFEMLSLGLPPGRRPVSSQALAMNQKSTIKKASSADCFDRVNQGMHHKLKALRQFQSHNLIQELSEEYEEASEDPILVKERNSLFQKAALQQKKDTFIEAAVAIDNTLQTITTITPIFAAEILALDKQILDRDEEILTLLDDLNGRDQLVYSMQSKIEELEQAAKDQGEIVKSLQSKLEATCKTGPEVKIMEASSTVKLTDTPPGSLIGTMKSEIYDPAAIELQLRSIGNENKLDEPISGSEHKINSDLMLENTSMRNTINDLREQNAR